MGERPTAIEIIKQLRDAGLDAWDSIPDPDAYLQEIRGCRQAEIDSLTADRDALTAERDELRNVLEQVELSGRDGMFRVCPKCGGGVNASIAHQPTCPLGRALNRPECGETAT